jgi:hypothetical protein
MHGRGVYVYDHVIPGRGKAKEAAIYEGTFMNNMRHGYGRYIFPSGEYLDGEYYFEKMHGQGTNQLASGNRYTGQF